MVCAAASSLGQDVPRQPAVPRIDEIWSGGVTGVAAYRERRRCGAAQECAAAVRLLPRQRHAPTVPHLDRCLAPAASQLARDPGRAVSLTARAVIATAEARRDPGTSAGTMSR
ncbi:hypothetical protein GCM10027079_26900 [Sediminivirga luteola]|uniref:Uncharacterized protein n=1 Tax=Sediminivirga luteola TaxID=1774748 RepID=A0A8J2XM98_9MICO|nr:hypothetical protein GCM10011333_29400 [Sediminivirga luteola]